MMKVIKLLLLTLAVAMCSSATADTFPVEMQGSWAPPKSEWAKLGAAVGATINTCEDASQVTITPNELSQGGGIFVCTAKKITKNGSNFTATLSCNADGHPTTTSLSFDGNVLTLSKQKFTINCSKPPSTNTNNQATVSSPRLASLPLKDCSSIGAANSMDYLDCLDANRALLDERMAVTYKNALNSLQDKDKIKLENDQKVWLKSLASCVKSGEEGPRAAIGAGSCRNAKINERIKVLESKYTASTNQTQNSSNQKTLNYSHGKYVGEALNGKANGFGTYTAAATGVTYTGQFINDSFNGDGTMTWPDGSKFTGRWEKDAGIQGAITYANGKTALGVVKNGKFISK